MPDVNNKQSKLLTAARTLFWKYGFKKVSIQDVCLEAGISKMTYYRFFKNKTELAKAVFEQEAQDNLEKFRGILQENISPQEKLMKLVDMKQESANGISKEFLHDFYNSGEPELKAYIDEQTQQAWNDMLDDFKKAQADGVFRKNLKPEFFLYFSRVAAEMLNDERLQKLYNTPHELLSEVSRVFAYGVAGQK